MLQSISPAFQCALLKLSNLRCFETAKPNPTPDSHVRVTGLRTVKCGLPPLGRWSCHSHRGLPDVWLVAPDVRSLLSFQYNRHPILEVKFDDPSSS